MYNPTHKWALPRSDINSPDLYIPLMSFLTYVLLAGFSKGMTTSSFTPDVLIIAVWRCLFLQIIESVIIKVGVNVMSVSLPFLDVFAYTGYKYIGLCVNLITLLCVNLISLATSIKVIYYIYYIASLYTSAALGFFVLKSMAAVVPASTSTGPPRHIMLISFAALQFVVAYVLSLF
jgi:protein transport protein YIF1